MPPFFTFSFNNYFYFSLLSTIPGTSETDNIPTLMILRSESYQTHRKQENTLINKKTPKVMVPIRNRII
jgi:hypothetical protein